MAILGTLLKKGIRLRESLEQEYSSPFDLQKQELRKLLITTAKTQIAQKYGFKNVLVDMKNRQDPTLFYQTYKSTLPIYNYNKIYTEWWHKTKEGKKTTRGEEVQSILP